LLKLHGDLGQLLGLLLRRVLPLFRGLEAPSRLAKQAPRKLELRSFPIQFLGQRENFFPIAVTPEPLELIQALLQIGGQSGKTLLKNRQQLL
jgi:hypothetical protein